ncbi:hypothetical protein CALCODRAFT_75637 [Calocera cornea HHB12733]|uniref:Uncharacterized protein n=1 Tax=Calocera cornea HHB12733 TaxID=1353952 RepID=A0A165DHQ1_9BASI|nr:hypothetical protein CALCODRAFT_75637 [Calocera cornea HHB12733]
MRRRCVFSKRAAVHRTDIYARWWPHRRARWRSTSSGELVLGFPADANAAPCKQPRSGRAACSIHSLSSACDFQLSAARAHTDFTGIIEPHTAIGPCATSLLTNKVDFESVITTPQYKTTRLFVSALLIQCDDIEAARPTLHILYSTISRPCTRRC